MRYVRNRRRRRRIMLLVVEGPATLIMIRLLPLTRSRSE
jgi:hypothetical protein